ncbi:MAG: FmdB family zinc ribbon protein [Acidimicrobiales bacterium]
MPTYEYVCKNCGNGFEVTQAFTDSTLTTCGTCGGPLRKVYGSIGIVFKGGGFYRTESRSGRTAAVPANNGSSSGAATANASEPMTPSKENATSKDSGGPAPTGATTTKAAEPTGKT